MLLFLITLTATSQITLTFAPVQPLWMDSVVVINLDKGCDTTLYNGSTIDLYLQASNPVGVEEIEKIKYPERISIYNLQGQELNELQEDGINIIRFLDSGETIKIFGKLNQNVDLFKYKSSNKVLNNWSWDMGDMLEMTAYVTGYISEPYIEAPTEDKTYLFYFEPYITGTVSGHIYYLHTIIPIEGVNINISGNYTFTDSTGYYEIVSPIGSHTLIATKSGYDNYVEVLNITTAPMEVNIAMTSDLYTHTISGQVFGCYGETLSDVEVICDNTYLNQITNENGEFTMNGVPEGQRYISFNHDYFGYSYTNIYLNSDTILNFQYQYCASVCDVDSIEHGGQWYHTVQVGDQCWLKENLNIGEFKLSYDTATNNGIIEKYCYNNLQEYCDTFGGLYSWEEMMQYVEVEGTQGICPDGWHPASNYEWNVLEAFADTVANNPNAALYLKDESFGGTNIYGMSIIGCGSTNNMGGWYSLEWGDYWTSTPQMSGDRTARYFKNDINHIYTNNFNMDQAKGVRCLKNSN